MDKNSKCKEKQKTEWYLKELLAPKGPLVLNKLRTRLKYYETKIR